MEVELPEIAIAAQTIAVPKWALWTLGGLGYFVVGVLAARMGYRHSKKPDAAFESLMVLIWPIAACVLSIAGILFAIQGIVTYRNGPRGQGGDFVLNDIQQWLNVLNIKLATMQSQNEAMRREMRSLAGDFLEEEESSSSVSSASSN